MDFFLFILVNATLFIRPSEFIPGLDVIPIYNILIIATLAVALPGTIGQLQPQRLFHSPASFCVLALIPAILLSHLSHFDAYSARIYAFDFSKVVIYYFLLCAVVNTTDRFRTFVYSLAIFTTVIAVLAMLQYFEIVNIPSLAVLEYSEEADLDGEANLLRRLRGTGIFNDPNDLAMIAVFASVICLYGLGDKALGGLRFAWLLPLAALLTTLILTKSRGGAMAMFAASGLLISFRFGVWKALAAMGALAPALLLLGSRQTDLAGAFSSGTGAGRAGIWSDGLMLFKTAPVFGVGYGRFSDEIGYVAHNSFVQAYCELGLFGGAMFLGAFWYAALSAWKIARPSHDAASLLLVGDVSRRTSRFALALLVGCAVSSFSISRTYVVPTYLALGLAGACIEPVRRQGLPVGVDLTPRQLLQLVPATFIFFITIILIVRFSVS